MDPNSNWSPFHYSDGRVEFVANFDLGPFVRDATTGSVSLRTAANDFSVVATDDISFTTSGTDGAITLTTGTANANQKITLAAYEVDLTASNIVAINTSAAAGGVTITSLNTNGHGSFGISLSMGGSATGDINISHAGDGWIQIYQTGGGTIDIEASGVGGGVLNLKGRNSVAIASSAGNVSIEGEPIDPSVGNVNGNVLTRVAGRWEGVAPSGGGSSSFADDVFRVTDNGDATKKLAFEVSGVTTGTTRTVTIPNADGTLLYNALTSAHLFVGSAGNVATDVAVTGDVTISNAGVTAIGAGKVTNTMLAGTITVALGGTGATTLTNHGILLGQGTSAIAATAVGTDGQIVVGQSAADPLWKTLSNDITSISAAGSVVVKQGRLTEATWSSNTTGIGVGPTDITNATVTFNAVQGRKYKYTALIRCASSAANIAMTITLSDGAGTAKTSWILYNSVTNGVDATVCWVEDYSAASATITRKLRAGIASGTMAVNASARDDFLLVEDLGTV